MACLEEQVFKLETVRPETIEQLDVDHERQLYDDTTTWLAEVLDGTMRTPFEYHFDGRELYGRDGRPLRPIFTKAITNAEQLGSNLAFEERRRKVELTEYEDMIAMAKGDGPNTMVVVSDFPEELMAAIEDVGGYNVLRKQTMLRVIYRTPSGTINMVSQSLDGSDRTGLEAIYRALNHEARPGELLGQRLKIDLEQPDQETLIDYLTGVYDRHLSYQYGGNWYAGRRGGKDINTYDFVCKQTDLLNAFMYEAPRFQIGDESLLYDLAASMNARFTGPIQEVDPTITNYDPHVTLMAMHHAGAEARAKGETFNGCGISLRPETMNTEAELNDNGYGNKTDEETKYDFDRHMYCVVCQAPPQKGETKKMCGPCGICRSCDRHLKSKL